MRYAPVSASALEIFTVSTTAVVRTTWKLANSEKYLSHASFVWAYVLFWKHNEGSEGLPLINNTL